VEIRRRNNDRRQVFTNWEEEKIPRRTNVLINQPNLRGHWGGRVVKSRKPKNLTKEEKKSMGQGSKEFAETRSNWERYKKGF